MSVYVAIHLAVYLARQVAPRLTCADAGRALPKEWPPLGATG